MLQVKEECGGEPPTTEIKMEKMWALLKEALAHLAVLSVGCLCCIAAVLVCTHSMHVL
jgi:hypothetical protein